MVVELITFTSPCSHNASMESKRLRRFDRMPGNVQNAAPATVFPLSLCKWFVHERAYPLIENEYKNGESQRSCCRRTAGGGGGRRSASRQPATPRSARCAAPISAV